ncbi:Suppressor protein of bem1/bed5 double mutant, partial [Smittium culicis]
MASVDFLGKAVELVNKAISEDTSGNFEDAYKLYMQSLDYFMTSLKYEKNQKVRDSIRKKLEEYLERAEKLKAHISNKNNSKQAMANGTDSSDK